MSTYYLIIEGEKVIVTEEVYRAYKRPEWAESRRRERESRCRNYNGVRCNEDCELCDKVRSGNTLPLEKFIDDGHQFIDPFDFTEDVSERQLLEQVHVEFAKLSNEEKHIIKIALGCKSDRHGAAEAGLPHKTFTYKRDKIFGKLKKVLEIFAQT